MYIGNGRYMAYINHHKILKYILKDFNQKSTKLIPTRHHRKVN